MVQTGARAGLGLARMMHGINDHLCTCLSGETFATMVAVSIDPASGALACANAGHPPALVLGPGGAARRLHSGINFPLGVEPGSPIDSQDDRLAPGELLVLFTDGLTDVRTADGPTTRLGLDGLSKQLAALYAAAPDRPLDDMARRIKELLDRLQRGHLADDDRTFLLARLRPRA
jgi:serine phosphatase RsbU (regulator of sigma subunit)